MPRKKQLPLCGRTFDDSECTERGDHVCIPRRDHIAAFFSEILVHTKGRWSRTAFRLLDWQLDDIMVPLFATVTWSAEFSRYVRRYRMGWIEVARKNGKALATDTAILASSGWTTMGELRPGDMVHAEDGSLTKVQWVSDRHVRPSYLVTFADGAKIVAADDHKWLVNDRRLSKAKRTARVATTAELAETLTYNARGDYRYSVEVPGVVERPEVYLPIDPYVLGAWLGDGTSNSAKLTGPDPEIFDAFEAAGYPATYCYPAGAAVTRGFVGGLRTALRELGVLKNKHVPEVYLTASADQRLALLRGLMDSDGSVAKVHSRVEFTSINRSLADAVLLLARSLGWKAKLTSRLESRLDGRMVRRYCVCWTAYAARSPFRLARKTDRLVDPPATMRSSCLTNSIVAIEPVGEREVVCIAVEHPSHLFLAGRSLTPTHNSELLAGIALYGLVADDESGAEIYGAAVDRDQARKVYDVAERMVHLSPLLSSRLKINKQSKRIYDVQSGSYYEVVAADAGGNLGHNPHFIVFDEVLTQKNGDLWNAMRTGMGAREQPLMVAATTAGDNPDGFGKLQHDEMQKVADDPERARHVFVFMRNLPADADPWDEANWALPNPALGQFLSIQALRDEALEAKNDPSKENAFRQFRLNQWVAQAHRWMPMHLWDECTGDLWLNPQWHNDELRGRTAYAGFDLAAKFDLTAWALVIPGDEPRDDPAHIIWRFWLPESGLEKLDQFHDGKFTRWAKQGWLTITEGSVIDYDKVIADIAEDAETYKIVAGDCDEWSMWPIINRIGEALQLDVENGDLVAYRNTYDRISPGMDSLMGAVKRGLLRHHGNPVARFCFDQCEVRHAPYDPNLVRPEKPERGRDKARIDAVPAAAMAMNAWKSREGVDPYESAYERDGLMVI